MDHNNDLYHDEDGEAFMDPDMPSDRDPSPKPYTLVPYDYDDDDDWNGQRSPTPLFDSALGTVSKPRKRLIKKSSASAMEEGTPDFDEGKVPKRKKDKEGGSSSSKKEKRPKKDKGSNRGLRGKGLR